MKTLVFSDLHVTKQKWPLCHRILKHIHEEAIQNNGRVLFAGDFFDHSYSTGAMSIELLNELAEFFANEWKVELWLMVGNHDMLAVEGGTNGLEVFAKVNPKIHVVSVPTVIENQVLMVPYEHHLDKFQECIQKYLAKHPLKIIFGHFDTIGAQMNASVKSERGVDAHFFPPSVSVYSGHYHRPHTHGQVTYIGSPYQTSLSEAGDQKRLLCFDINWNRLEDKPLDFGPKHFKITPNTSKRTIEQILDKGFSAQDRIVFDRLDSLPESVVLACQKAGVTPIVRKKQKTFHVDCHHAENVGPERLFKQFLETNPRSNDDSLLVQKGIDAIRSYGTFQQNTFMDSKELLLMTLTLENFGPYRSATLDLNVPGIALILAEKEQGESIGSNGSGKSLLSAGGLLFTLCGNADPRPTMDGSSNAGATYDLIHNGKDFVKGQLCGTINGMKFRITRTLMKRKHLLVFEEQDENGVWIDKTRSTIKMTQVDINESLLNLSHNTKQEPGKQACQFLLQTIIWSQHKTPGLLEQSNESAKASLRALVQAEAWETLANRMKEHYKEDKMRVQTQTTLCSQTEAALKELEEQISVEEERSTQWEITHQKEVNDTSNQSLELKKKLNQVKSFYDECATINLNHQDHQQEMETALQHLAELKQIQQLAKTQGALKENLDIDKKEDAIQRVSCIQKEYEEVSSLLKQTEDDIRHCEKELAVSQSNVSRCQSMCDRFEKGVMHAECQQCFQPIQETFKTSKRSELENEKKVFNMTLEKNKTLLTESCSIKEKRLIQMKELQRKLQEAKETVSAIDASIRYKEADEKISKIEKQMIDLRQKESIRLEHEKKRQSLYREMSIAKQNYTHAFENEQRILNQVNPSKSRLNDLLLRKNKANEKNVFSIKERNEATESMNLHKSLSEIMGKDGVPNRLAERLIQTFEEKLTSILDSIHPGLNFALVFNEKGRLVKNITANNTGSSRMATVLSGGEHRRLQLAGFLSFSDIALQTQRLKVNLRILDEPLQGVDGNGVRAFIDVLKRECSQMAILLVSHRPFEINFAFDRVLKIHQTIQGISSLV